MKRIFTFCLAFFAFSMLQAQSPRMTMVEEATQASCPPCASQNPALQALLNVNTDKAIFIAYQVWWPGYDPMYLDNPTEVDSRIGDYYSSITGAPNIVVQGDSGGQPVSYLTQSLINTTFAEMSEFDINITGAIEDGILTVTGDVTATAAAAGDLRLRLVLTEHTIYNEDLVQIGTNGETEFHHVFKKFFNGPEGITLEAAWEAGDTYTVNETLDLSTINVYNFGELEVVAMIQNDDNKFVHQAARVDELDITVSTTNNAGVYDVAGIPAVVCAGTQTVEPQFNLQNNGNDELTSATITYNVNGGANQVYDWSGSLSTLSKETVTLPGIEFDAETSNVVNITVSEPNGIADEDNSDDLVVSSEITLAPELSVEVTVEILTDNYGVETSWSLVNEEGTTLASGSGYANNTLYTETVELPTVGCHEFIINDSYGDGICCAWGNGYYNLKNADGVNIITGGEFGSTTTEPFGNDMVNSVNNLNELTGLRIAPNPASNEVNLSFSLVETLDDVTIEVYNVIGQQVMVDNIGNLITGTQNIKMDVATLQNGIYMITIASNDKLITRKLQIQK